MRGAMHHIDLTVRDPQKSFALYDAVLKMLGFDLVRQDDNSFEWKLETPSGPQAISIVRAIGPGAERAHDRYSPGLHHLAWTVESRAAVDEIHLFLTGIGATILDPPAEYPQYNKGRGYYAVFFTDPDGLKLEAVFTEP
jgi:glyoxylase I family protein